MALHDVEREKDGSAKRQRPRQTRKGSVSIAQILLVAATAYCHPRFNMLTLRWAGERERRRGTERREKKEKLERKRREKRQKEKYASDRIAGKGRSKVEAAARGWRRAPTGLGIPGTAQTAAPDEKKVCRVTTKDVCYWRSI